MKEKIKALHIVLLSSIISEVIFWVHEQFCLAFFLYLFFIYWWGGGIYLQGEANVAAYVEEEGRRNY